jgi:hypothetical protein
MLAARADSGKTDSGAQSKALQSCLTANGMLLDVDKVLMAQLCKESIIFLAALHLNMLLSS